MNKHEAEEVDKLFRKFKKHFQSRCRMCHGKYNKDESWVIHHRDYITGEKTYADFKKMNSKGNLVPDKLAYYQYLTPKILNNPKRFYLMHYSHHWMCEMGARLNRANFERYVKITREIIKRKDGEHIL